MAKVLQKKLPVMLDWLELPKHIAQIMAIEIQSTEFPWTEEDFVRYLSQRCCIGMVAENEKRVVGYMIYELQGTRIHLLNFAVASEYRRQGVGSQMIARQISKLSPSCRSWKRIVLEVGETNLPVQLFFKANGFHAISILHGLYEDTYIMEYYRHRRHRPFMPVNRLAMFGFGF
jgi:ribosomal-protein-alanine N-acetyltransferase